jgi:hypothetical protein
MQGKNLHSKWEGAWAGWWPYGRESETRSRGTMEKEQVLATALVECSCARSVFWNEDKSRRMHAAAAVEDEGIVKRR